MNSTLKSERQVQEAFGEVERCGLPPHIDGPKNWDAISALKFVLDRTREDASILEVGATLYSVMLPWLYLYGYRRLHGIDLVFDRAIQHGPIHYEYGDLTRLRFNNESLDVVLSLSVIEHGVDIEDYFREASRVLRPSGLLITSTDYWCEPIDTQGKTAYGYPVHIFTKPEMERLLDVASRYGLGTTSNIDLNCEEKPILWGRLDVRYTFTCFALQKTA